MSDAKHQSLWNDRTAMTFSDGEIGSLRADDIVVGAGLTGLTTAVLLARAGREVVVLEARSIGAVTTGNTTAKISLLQGTRLSDILSRHSERIASAYLEANQEGKSWIERYCADHAVDFQRRDCFSYAATDEGREAVDKEYEAGRRLGLEVERMTDLDVPFPHVAAVGLAGQSQFDPMDMLYALAAEFRGRGGRIYEGVRVTDVDAGVPARVRTRRQTFTCSNVVLATGVPFLDRGLYFAKVEPQRSYAIALDVPELSVGGMYLSVDAPTRSVRTAPHSGSEKLLVGGNGHFTGRSQSPRAAVEGLERWALSYYEGATVTHRWSAQDYATHDYVPFVGKLPRGRGHVYLATGYGKWGMTNAVAAALRISAEIHGNEPSWGKPIARRLTRPTVFLDGVRSNAAIALELGKGWVGMLQRSEPSSDELESENLAYREGLRATASANVDGSPCKLSAVCTHMGGIVRWNDAEKSWDCPLHGSRFAADGAVLEGPATKALKQFE